MSGPIQMPDAVGPISPAATTSVFNPPGGAAPGGGAGLGGALAAGGQVVGAIAGGLFSEWSASRSRKWQERMANTAHQREVADLRKAGLNPILSATRGAGADTGSSSGVVHSGEGLSSAAKIMALEVPRIQSEIALNSAGAAQRHAETQRVEALTRGEVDKLAAEKRLIDANAALSVSSARGQGYNQEEMRLRSRLWNKGNQAADWIESAVNGLMNRGNAYGGQSSARSGKW